MQAKATSVKNIICLSAIKGMPFVVFQALRIIQTSASGGQGLFSWESKTNQKNKSLISTPYADSFC